MSELPFILDPDTGEKRIFGNIPAPLRYSWPVFGDVPNTKLIPRDRWASLVPDDEGPGHPLLSDPHDQDGVGMCNCSATAGAIEDARLRQGLPMVRLSGGDLYKRICFNGRDSGSTLEDGIRAAMSEGIASVDVVPYMDWRNSHAGAEESRKKYRVLEAFLCPTFDHCFSASIQGFDLISGVWWYNSGFDPDSGGWMPSSGGGGRGGHAVRGYKPARRGQKYGIWHRNSWTARWGLGGDAVFPEAWYVQGGIGGWWAVRSVVDEGGDVPAPKVS